MRNEVDTRDFARRIRAHALRMVAAANASHIGSCLSIADILAVLYASALRIDPREPSAPNRDRFILSKGHAAAILYAALAERGFFPLGDLASFCRKGSPLTGHISHAVPGVEVSTGSLGHGLPLAAGMALAARADKRATRVFCLLSDGECDEGSNWEAILFAGHHRLANLTAIVDYNKIQSFGRVADVLDLHPFADKWRAFGWDTVELDGHDHAALDSALASRQQVQAKPRAVIAHTIKGKGVPYMEDRLEWHYKSPNPEQLAQALAELEA
jgi:transketolase